MKEILINEGPIGEKPKVKKPVKVKMSKEEFEMNMLQWLQMMKKEVVK